MVHLKRVLFDACAGAGMGAVATAPMSALMLAAQRAGLMGTQPPRRITDEAIEAADEATDETEVNPPESARRGLTALSHLGFGAVAAVPFAVLHRAIPATALREALGALYAVGVWASAYLGWVPAIGIMPPADKDRHDRPLSMIAAHLVYGAALGAGIRLLSRKR